MRIPCRVILQAAAFSAIVLGDAYAAEPPAGVASCSGCHPAKRFVDTSVPRLVGRNAAELLAAMQGFKSGALPSTIMGRIARGFSDDEIKAIADWYAAQKD